MIRQYRKRQRTIGNRPPPSVKPPTPTCYVTVKNVLTEGVKELIHPSHTPTEYDDIVGLESLVHGIPNQTTPNHRSARCWIIGYLGEPSGVDLDSLG